MHEGLKNAGGSFSRMTSKVLSTKIGRNMLTYIDDIIVRIAKPREPYFISTKNLCQLLKG
jgi:hypothetical protein